MRPKAASSWAARSRAAGDSRAWAATLCSQSTSYLVATVWVIEVKSRFPRLMAYAAGLGETHARFYDTLAPAGAPPG